jgi:hypothetical protein
LSFEEPSDNLVKTSLNISTLKEKRECEKEQRDYSLEEGKYTDL